MWGWEISRDFSTYYYKDILGLKKPINLEDAILCEGIGQTLRKEDDICDSTEELCNVFFLDVLYSFDVLSRPHVETEWEWWWCIAVKHANYPACHALSSNQPCLILYSIPS